MSFRKDFVWGAATSAYQIEGAVKEECDLRIYKDSDRRAGNTGVSVLGTEVSL